MAEVETVACKYCGDPTPMLGTRLCDNCWEISRNLRAYIEKAKKGGADLLVSAVLQAVVNSYDPNCEHGPEVSFTPIPCFSGDVYICACGAWYDLHDTANANDITKVLSHQDIVNLIMNEQREAARRALGDLVHTVRAKMKAFEE